jgi:hypothetical protein
MGYDVFISYSQEGDARVAEAVRDALTRFAKPWWRRRALRVFLDRSVLSANPGMWSSISAALDESEWLVLLASPESARSEWVNRELSHWLADRGPDRLIVARRVVSTRKAMPFPGPCAVSTARSRVTSI